MCLTLEIRHYVYTTAFVLVVRSCQSDQKNKSVEGEIAVGFIFLLVLRLFALLFFLIFYFYFL